ncbi:MAG TPA: tetratricopeptide repeat protein [Streptosporangiaceae bacterium]|nr:tetratricopeptide repeat protein [Streptosporangiaceae bacterium]
MSMLGILLTKQGKNAEAEQWYRRAADAGQVNGMYNLGSC